MQRINLYDFYQLANSLHGISGLSGPLLIGSIVIPLFQASSALTKLLNDPVIALGYSRPAATALYNAVDKAFSLIQAPEGTPWEEISKREIPAWEISHIGNLLQTFEHNLAAELQQMDTYYVLRKSIYATPELIERAENLFSEGVRVEMLPEAIEDIRQAGRCIAFELPTAAGFHILRSVESVMLRYMDTLNAQRPKEKQRNWGAYLQTLKDAGADEKVIAALDQIRDLHRNPNIHPEETLTLEEALSLLGIAQSAILGMVRDIRKHSGSAEQPSLPAMAS